MRPKNELRPYQQRIAEFLYEHDEALCIARPGAGKTISALTAIEELALDGVIRAALVIAPKRVANAVWPEEIKTWEHTEVLKPFVLTGTPTGRQNILDFAASGLGVPIAIVGIDNVEWLLGALDKYGPDHPLFDLLVIDEISKIRNPTGVRAKLLAKHAPRWKMVWGLSGTLRPNSALDLFMPVRVVTRGKLWGRSFYKWREKYFYPADFNGYDWRPFLGAETTITAEIKPLIVSLRADEMPQLPALTVIQDHVDLPPQARAMYQDMHRKLIANTEDGAVLALNSAVATGKLAQIANGFVYGAADHRSRGGPVTEVHDEKREWIADIIDNAIGPTILVYEYRHDLQMIRELLGDDVPFLGADLSAGDCLETIKDWNRGRYPFLALHPAAGGHGLNLQGGGADMAWIAPTWSPEFWEQTLARLHRSGQTKPVIVRVCVARGTVDEMKLNRVYGKMSAQAAFEAYISRRGT